MPYIEVHQNGLLTEDWNQSYGGANFNNIFKTKVYNWSENAPEWRFVKAGLCFEGKCLKTDCKALNQMVIINMGVPVSLDIFGFDGSRPTNCPACKTFVKPLTFAFNNCFCRYIGRRITQNGPEKQLQKSDWANVGDEYFRFDESKQVEWKSLVLETRLDTSTIPEQELKKLDEDQIQVTKEINCQSCLDVNTNSQANSECPCRQRPVLETCSLGSALTDNQQVIISKVPSEITVKQGVALIINITEGREGAEKDHEFLGTEFERLGFSVCSKINLKDNQVVDLLQTYAHGKDADGKAIEEADCFLCVILSHGLEENGFLSLKCAKVVKCVQKETCVKDGKCDEKKECAKAGVIQNIEGIVYDLFNEANCNWLKDKPKLFVFGACRSPKGQDNIMSGATIVTNGAETRRHSTQIKRNFFISYATVSNFAGLRLTSKGDIHAQELIKVLKEHGDQMTLSDIFTQVNANIFGLVEKLTLRYGLGYAQMSMYRNSLANSVRFLGNQQKSFLDALKKYELNSASALLINTTTHAIASLKTALEKLHFTAQEGEHENNACGLVALVAGRLEEYKQAIRAPHCFVCVIVARGQDIDHQLKVDFEKEAHGLFNNEKCPKLVQCPKIFFLLHLNDLPSTNGETIDTNGNGSSSSHQQKNTVAFIPLISDFFFSYLSLSRVGFEQFVNILESDGASQSLEQLVTRLQAMDASAFHHSSLTRQVVFKFNADTSQSTQETLNTCINQSNKGPINEAAKDSTKEPMTSSTVSQEITVDRSSRTGLNATTSRSSQETLNTSEESNKSASFEPTNEPTEKPMTASV